MTKKFKYKFDAGPVVSQKDLLDDWNVGNCRRAVQLYIFEKKNLFLKPEEILCPAAYNQTILQADRGKTNIISI